MRRRKRMMEALEQEIREHIETETQDNIARGMPPEEACYAAIRKFGNVTRVKEDTREVWSFVWLEQLLQDFGFALRTRHQPDIGIAVGPPTLDAAKRVERADAATDHQAISADRNLYKQATI